MDELRSKPRKFQQPIDGALDQLAALRAEGPAGDDDDTPEAKQRYAHYYDRIYPLLGRIDYALIAEKTGFKERRIKETLLFRLGAGEVRQLFGHKQGYCYICKLKMGAPKSTEPLCLSCLQELNTTIQECHIAPYPESAIRPDPTGKIVRPPSDPYREPYPEPEPELEPELEPENYSREYVSRREHEKVLRELADCREQVRELQRELALARGEEIDAPEVVGEADEADSPFAIVTDPETEPANSEESTETAEDSDVLSILDRTEAELRAEAASEAALLEPPQALRQHGFQRLRSTSLHERSHRWS